MDEPEIIKMLKYILLFGCLAICAQCHPLVTEQPSVTSAASVTEENLVSTSGSPKPKDMAPFFGGKVEMSPVVNISDIQDELELAPNNTGGQKHVRQALEPSPSGSPPPSDELCSIFQFFLEPRRYSRCRVSNSYSENERSEGPRVQSGSFELNSNSNFHRPVSKEVSSSDSRPGDTYQSQSENREVESSPLERQNMASKRYDTLDEYEEEGGPPPPLSPPGSEEDHPPSPPGPPPPHQHHHHNHHHHHHHHHPLVGAPPPQPPPPGPPPMYPKSSLDRTTIIVPERPCPRGERRDHKGFCRRIVRVRPSYQYGPPPPPPPPYGPSRPVRYYYSRFVSVPTLQFFIPAVP